MSVSIVSSKFQVAIPKAIRDQLGLFPGQRLRVLAYDDRIELIPVRPLESLRGFLEGIDATVPRGDDER